MSSNALRTAMAKAYRKTRHARLEALLAEESRWKRKATIAQNKLARARAKLAEFTSELVKEIEPPLECPKGEAKPEA